MRESDLPRVDRLRSLRLKLSTFVSGEDTSLSLANMIEVELDSLFPSHAGAQDAVEILARYRPTGGELLLDHRAVSYSCQVALAVVDAELARP